MDNKYNGWTNYETWDTKLWMDEYGDDFEDEIKQIVANSVDGIFCTASTLARQKVARLLKDFYFEKMNETVSASGLYADLLDSALRRVNWHEIAQSLIDDIEEGEDAGLGTHD